MTIKYFKDLVQGSDEWFAARCGILTASEMKLIITPTLKIASNDKERAHLYELLAQRITSYVEPRYIGDDMIRGNEDEVKARLKYAEVYADVEEMGFVTNDEFGFTLGYSPDGLIGDNGQIEVKSRRQKFQIQTIVENVLPGTIPEEYIFQVQTGLIVTKRHWCDFISYSGGLNMVTMRIYPDPKVQNAIIEAAGAFEKRIVEKKEIYDSVLRSLPDNFVPTERTIEQEITA